MDTDEHGSEMDFNRANEFAHKQAGVSFGFVEEAFALSLSVFIRIHPWFN
jgi:hypothetical protein